MAVRTRRSPSFRQQIEGVNKAMRGLEAMYGDVRVAKGRPEPGMIELAPKRQIVNRSDPNLLEGAVMREIEPYLRTHPAILFAVRQNGGAMETEGEGGDLSKIWFYRWVKRRTAMRISDFWGLADFGLWAIEAKRRDWVFTGTVKREIQQAAFHDVIRTSGGRAGFARCVEDAQKIIEGEK